MLLKHLADAAAKNAALSGPRAPDSSLCFSGTTSDFPLLAKLVVMPDLGGESEKEKRSHKGCQLHPEFLWHHPDGCLVAPKKGSSFKYT